MVRSRAMPSPPNVDLVLLDRIEQQAARIAGLIRRLDERDETIEALKVEASQVERRVWERVVAGGDRTSACVYAERQLERLG